MASFEATSQVDQLPHSATIVSDAGEPTSATQVDPEAQLPLPPPPTDDPPVSFLEKLVSVVVQLSLLAAIFSDTGEPTPASQVDPEAQLPPRPPPPPTDDPPASFLEKALPVVLQLSLSAGMVASGSPTAGNHGHELAFKLDNLAALAVCGFDLTLGICLIGCFPGTDRPWVVRQAANPLIAGVLALSVATAVLGAVLNLLP